MWIVTVRLGAGHLWPDNTIAVMVTALFTHLHHLFLPPQDRYMSMSVSLVVYPFHLGGYLFPSLCRLPGMLSVMMLHFLCLITCPGYLIIPRGKCWVTCLGLFLSRYLHYQYTVLHLSILVILAKFKAIKSTISGLTDLSPADQIASAGNINFWPHDLSFSRWHIQFRHRLSWSPFSSVSCAFHNLNTFLCWLRVSLVFLSFSRPTFVQWPLRSQFFAFQWICVPGNSGPSLILSLSSLSVLLPTSSLHTWSVQEMSSSCQCL